MCLRAGLYFSAVSHGALQWGISAIALVMFARAIGDSELVGFFKKVGGSRFARLDTYLDEVFSWGKNMTHSSEKTPKISAIANVTYITAELSQSADEKCAALNLSDSIILIELDGAIPLQSGFVGVRAAKIRLYPTNI